MLANALDPWYCHAIRGLLCKTALACTGPSTMTAKTNWVEVEDGKKAFGVWYTPIDECDTPIVVGLELFRRFLNSET